MANNTAKYPSTGVCPHCGTEIYYQYVLVNGRCPVSDCDKKLSAEELAPSAPLPKRTSSK